MIYYNIMADGHAHPHHYHRHAAPARFSLLRAGAGERLAMIGAAAVMLWLAVAWALGWV